MASHTTYEGADNDRYLVGVGDTTGKKLLHFEQRSITWERFMSLVRSDKLPKNKYLAGGAVFGKFGTVWSPSCGCPGSDNKTRHRSRESVVSRNLITLDADSPNKVPDFEQNVLGSGLAGVMYHSASATKSDPRWRVVVRPSRSMSPGEYWTVTKVLMDRFGRAAFDPSTAQHERVMYLPATSDKRSFKWHEFSGALLDIDAVLASDEGQAVKPRGESTAIKAATAAEVTEWMNALSDDEQCQTVAAALGAAEAAFKDADPNNLSRELNRHQVALRYTTRLAFLGDQGHGGVCDAFGDLEALYDQYVGDEHGANAFAEMLPGAIGQTLVDPTDSEDRMCCLTPDFGSSVAVTKDAGNPVAERLTGKVTRALGFPSKVRPWTARSPRLNNIAKQIVHDLWMDRGDDGSESCYWLRAAQGSFYEWHGTHWQVIPPLHLEAQVKRVLDQGRWNLGEGWKQIEVTPKVISNIVKLMEMEALVPDDLLEKGQGWIDCTNGRCPVGGGENTIAFANGLLDMVTREFREKHESAFFNTFSMHFDFDPEAECPGWLAFLESIFPGDQASKDAIEEYIGYLALGDNTFQKVLALLGKPRAGKGTIMRLVEKMLGPAYMTVQMSDLAGSFALQPLVGKRVVHIAEAVSVQEIRKVVALLKAISGNDGQMQINPKGEKQYTATLGCVFVISGNNEIVLPDGSGVIIDRIEGLDFKQSFLGREDLGLQDRLNAELPGIFNRVLRAYDRVSLAGEFTQSEGGVKMKQRMKRDSAPEKTWFNDCFEVTKDESDWIALQAIADRWKMDLGDAKVSDRAAKGAVGRILREHGDGTSTHRSTYGGVPSTRAVLGLRWRIDPRSGETVEEIVEDAKDAFAGLED